MTLKSYFAESVESAVSLARLELGAEAMLMSSRRTGPENRHLGEYEVVFASIEAEPSFGRELSRAAGAPAPVVDRLASEVAELKRQLERTASIFHRAGGFPMSAAGVGPEFFRLFSWLMSLGLEPEIASNLLTAIRQSAEPAGDLLPLVREELRKLLIPYKASEGAAKPWVLALVGPPGAGKTTTLIKLAVSRGLALRKRVHLVSTDAQRVGGADQLRTYAAVLGVSFEAADGKAALTQTIESHRHCDLILIDTPGFDLRHRDLIQEGADALGAQPEIETHLVLSASARSETLRRLESAYEPFRAAKLVFTKLDEAEAYGTLINHALWSRKPISFLADGQSIPEDLQAASPGAIVDLVLGRVAEEVAAAAA